MPQTVVLPNNQELEFPDGMSHEDMASAIKKNFPQFSSSGGGSAQPKSANSQVNNTSMKDGESDSWESSQKKKNESLQKLSAGDLTGRVASNIGGKVKKYFSSREPEKVRDKLLPEAASSGAIGAGLGAALAGGAALVAGAPVTVPALALGAAYGGLSGASSSVAGNFAKSVGGSPFAEDAASLGAGIVGGEAIPLATKAGKFLTGKAGQAYRLVEGLMGKEATPASAVKQAQGNLYSGSNNAQNAIGEALQQKAKSAYADDVTGEVLSAEKSHAANVSRLEAEHQAAQQEHAKALAEHQAHETALSNKKSGLQNTPELSEIGKGIVNDVNAVQSGLHAKRAEEAKTLYAKVAEEAKSKEDSGNFWQTSPSGKEFLDNLSERIKVKNTTPTTNKETSSVNSLIDELKGNTVMEKQRVPSGRDPLTGAITYTEKEVPVNKPLSHKAVEQKIRELDDIANGKAPPTGFEAIGKRLAGEISSELKKSLHSWLDLSGEARSAYAAASTPLDEYKTTLGKNLTKKEDFDWGRLKNDPKEAPGLVFKSKKSIEDFKTMLGGGKEAEKRVNNYANQYAFGQIKDLDSAALNKWMQNKKNSDWIKNLPDLKQRLFQYRDQLSAIEKSALGSKEKVALAENALNKSASAVEGAKASTESILEQARKGGETKYNQTKSLLTQGGKDSGNILESLITGSENDFHKVAGYLKSDPKAIEQLPEAVSNILSGQSAAVIPGKGVTRVSEMWSEQVKPKLIKSGVMSEQDASIIDARIKAIDSAAIPPEEKKSLIKRALEATLKGSSIGMTSSKTAHTLKDAFGEKNQ